MHGLNHEFALEDDSEADQKVTMVTDSNFDETIFDNPTPGEVPKLKEDLDVIVQVKNKVDDLEYLRQDVSKAGGMNASFAMEAAALIPDFFSNGRQVGYFSTDLSKTQYQPTLEAIAQEKVSLLSKIVARIREMIGKCIAWLKQMFAHITKRGVSDKSMYVYANMNAAGVKGPLAKLSDILMNRDREINSLHARTNTSFKDVKTDEFFVHLTQRFQVMEKQVQGLYSSINASRLSKAVVFKPDVLKLCFAAANEESRTLQAFKALYDFTLSLGNGQVKFPSEGGKITNEIYERAVANVLDKVKIGVINLSPSEALAQVKATLDEVQDEEVSLATLPLNKLVGSFANLFTVQSATEALKDMHHSADEFSNFQRLLSQRDKLQLTGNPQEVEWAGRLLHKLSKEFNDQFVLRLNYSNLLNSYVNTGAGVGVLLQRYQRDIATSVGGMDEKFQAFVKSYFGNGAPDFFTAPDGV